MEDVESTEKPISISEDKARGALSPNEVSTGDTLVPMLLWGVGLTISGLVIALIVMFARAH